MSREIGTNKRYMAIEDELWEKECQAVDEETRALSPGQIERLGRQLSTPWKIVEGKKLRQEFNFEDFMSVMVFVNDVAAVAEEQNHHPDMLIKCKRVVLEITTKALDALTENDFIVAKKVEMTL